METPDLSLGAAMARLDQLVATLPKQLAPADASKVLKQLQEIQSNAQQFQSEHTAYLQKLQAQCAEVQQKASAAANDAKAIHEAAKKAAKAVPEAPKEKTPKIDPDLGKRLRKELLERFAPPESRPSHNESMQWKDWLGQEQ